MNINFKVLLPTKFSAFEIKEFAAFFPKSKTFIGRCEHKHCYLYCYQFCYQLLLKSHGKGGEHQWNIIRHLRN